MSDGSERENQSIRAVRIVCIIGEKEEERNTPFREATRQSRHRLQAAKKAGGSGRGVERWVSHLEGVAALNGEGLILAGIEKDSADIVVAKMFPPVQSESSNGRIRIQYSPSHPCPAFPDIHRIRKTRIAPLSACSSRKSVRGQVGMTKTHFGSCTPTRAVLCPEDLHARHIRRKLPLEQCVHSPSQVGVLGIQVEATHQRTKSLKSARFLTRPRKRVCDTLVSRCHLLTTPH